LEAQRDGRQGRHRDTAQGQHRDGTGTAQGQRRQKGHAKGTRKRDTQKGQPTSITHTKTYEEKKKPMSEFSLIEDLPGPFKAEAHCTGGSSTFWDSCAQNPSCSKERERSLSSLCCLPEKNECSLCRRDNRMQHQLPPSTPTTNPDQFRNRVQV